MELLNLDEANALVRGIEDATTRELVRYSLGLVVGKFLPWDGADHPPDLPAAPFDTAFYVRCMIQLFSRQERIARMLAGEVVDDIAAIAI